MTKICFFIPVVLLGFLLSSQAQAGDIYTWVKFSSCQTGGNTARYYDTTLETASVGAANGCFVLNGAPYSRVVGDCLRNKNNACTGGYTSGSGSCPDDQLLEPGYTDYCVDPPPECPVGQSWDEAAGGCRPPVPECAPGELLGDITVGGVFSYVCHASLEGDVDETCGSGGGGTAGGSVYCTELEDLCDQGGGQLVIIAGVQSCMHAEDEDLPPDCLGGINIWSNESGGFICSPKYEGPYDPEVTNPLGSWNGPNGGGGGGGPDSDGDGIPNRMDPDIDDDGIPNATDPDVDGDGIPNTGDPDIDDDGMPNQQDGDMDGDLVRNGADNDIDGDGIANDVDTDDDGDGVLDVDDVTPQGPNTTQGTVDEPSVQGGGNCDPTSSPSCTGGDPIQCATMWQVWKARCEQEGLTEEYTQAELKQFIDINAIVATGEGLIDTSLDAIGDSIIDSTGQLIDTDANSFGAWFLALLPSQDSCSGGIDINFFGNHLDLGCDRFEPLRVMLGWIFYIYTAYALFLMAMKPVAYKEH